MEMHRKYNIEFVNEILDNKQVWKSCTLLNEKDRGYEELWIYLAQILHEDSILDYYLPVIESVLNKKKDVDPVIESGSSCAMVEVAMTTIYSSSNVTVEIPTQDFKVLLEEYVSFWRTAPLNGDYVRKSN